ncbi:MAG TPA: FAD-dependent oxidoreductase [Pseudonocardiaceae bacterium]|nr:FAD-dependent oxidoreductase [Pseudonocardiaceae bacterium]
MTPRSVVVVGGGVIGLCCAYYLARAGLRVTVVERDRVGSGASRGNAGEICPDLVEPLPAPGVIGPALRTLHRSDAALYLRPRPSIELARFLLGFALHANKSDHRTGAAALAALAEDTFAEFEKIGVDVKANKNGFLYVYGSADTARRARQAARELGAPVGELLDHADLASHEPFLAGGARFGFHVDGQWSIDPNLFVDGLAGELRGLGVEIIEGARGTRIEDTGGRTRTHTSAGTVEADRVVLAAGIWTRQLGRALGVDLNIVPGKGYSFTVPATTLPSKLVHLGDAHVAVNPIGDALRIAGTMEFDRDHDRFDPRRIAAIVAAAKPYLDGVDWTGRRDEWVGPRPMTPDGLPAIGPLPGHENVLVASGHNMLGLMLAPSTGRLVADLITGDRPQVPAFDPARISRRAGRRLGQAAIGGL